MGLSRAGSPSLCFTLLLELQHFLLALHGPYCCLAIIASAAILGVVDDGRSQGVLKHAFCAGVLAQPSSTEATALQQISSETISKEATPLGWQPVHLLSKALLIEQQPHAASAARLNLGDLEVVAFTPPFGVRALDGDSSLTSLWNFASMQAGGALLVQQHLERFLARLANAHRVEEKALLLAPVHLFRTPTVPSTRDEIAPGT